MELPLKNLDGVELAFAITDAAFDAQRKIQGMNLFRFPGDGFLRANLPADSASFAGFRVDLIMDQGLTDAGRALLFLDVGPIFIQKIVQGGQDRVGSRLPQAAKGRVFDHGGEFL
jgi:hypothetical protein